MPIWIFVAEGDRLRRPQTDFGCTGFLDFRLAQSADNPIATDIKSPTTQ